MNLYNEMNKFRFNRKTGQKHKLEYKSRNILHNYNDGLYGYVDGFYVDH